MSKKSLAAAGARLSLLTLGSRVLGLVREMTKASLLGTTGLADAFGIAFMIPNLFRRLFAENSISVAFIPTFKAYLEDSNTVQGRTEAQAFLSATCTVVSFCTVLVTVIGIVCAPFIVPVFTGSHPRGIVDETVLLTRLMFPYLAIISFAAFLQGILNAVKIFSPSGFTPILFNLIIIVCSYTLGNVLGNPARAMAAGVILGGLVQAFFQLPFVLKTGWRVAWMPVRKAFANKGTRRVFALVGPTIIGMAAYQLNDVVSTALAGRAGSGIVSSLQYSLRLQELILGIFAVSIGTVILPDLSGLAKRRQWNEFSDMLLTAAKIIALITIPITFFAFCAGEHIIILVYKNNRFTDESVRLTLEAFRFHIAGLFFIALNRIMAPAFYAQGNTKQPTLAGIWGFAVNILLALCLSGSMGGGGIALALSAASAVNTVVLFIYLSKSRTVRSVQIVSEFLRYAVKLAVFSAAALVPTLFASRRLYQAFSGYGRIIGQGVPLVLSALLFACCGLALLVLTKDSLLAGVIAKCRRRQS